MNYESLEGIFAIVLTLSIPLVAIAGSFFVAIKKKNRETELRKAIIENHVDADSIKLLIKEQGERKHPFSMLRWGCILLGAGLGALTCALAGMTPKHSIYFWMTILAFMGIGMLISFTIELKLQKKRMTNKDSAEENIS